MNTGSRIWDKPFVPWIIHLCAWLVILFLPPFAMWRIDIAMNPPDYAKLFAIPLAIIIIFYLNYLFLIDRFLLRGKAAYFILWNMLIVALLLAAVYGATEIFRTCPGPVPPFPENPGGHGYPVPPGMDEPVFPVRPKRFIWGDIILCLLSIGIACAIKMTVNWSKAEKRRQELEKENMRAQLQNLKSQINPHFLFNSLNNIYSFVESNPRMARTSIENLCGLLRHALYRSNSRTVPFCDEVQFLKDYIDLALVRVTAESRISISLPDNPSDTPVAPMLFISLVENAFKHGICPGKESFVDISLTEGDGYITMQTENSIRRTSGDDHIGGIGLKNLLKRLEIMYRDKYSFDCGPDGDIYRTCLTIRTK